MMEYILPLIGGMDSSAQLKSFTMMMDKELAQKNTGNAEEILTKIQQIVSKGGVNVALEVEIFSLELKLGRLKGKKDK